MKRDELSKRVTRIQKEDARLKKEVWGRIQTIVKPYMQECGQFPGMKLIVFTRLKSKRIERWSECIEYKIQECDENKFDTEYIGFTEDGLILDVYFAMAVGDPFAYNIKQLYGILKQVEKMNFNNVVDFSSEAEEESHAA